MHLKLYTLILFLIPFLIFGCSSKNQIDIQYTKKVIPIGFDYDDNGFGGIIAYDLDQDGKNELIVSQKNYVAVYSTGGHEWWIKPFDIHLSNGKGWLPGYHAAGIQVARLENGNFAILFINSQNELVLIDALNGNILKSIQIPHVFESVKLWEHLVVCNFRGKGDKDLFIQATEPSYKEGFRRGRYIAAFSLSDLISADNPTPLWARDDFIGPGHGGARVADLNLDGKDEVIGATIIKSNGELAIKVPVAESPHDHVDAIHIDDIQPSLPGLEVVLLQENHGKLKSSGNHIFLFNMDGIIFRTHYNHIEPQNAAVGDFDPTRPGKEIWLRSRFTTDQKPFVLDSHGNFITSYSINEKSPLFWSKKGIEVITPVFWNDSSRQLIAAKERHTNGNLAIIDPMTGSFLVTIPENAIRLYVADIFQDGMEEIITVNSSSINIYVLENFINPAQAGNLWNNPNYRRSKHFGTYYYP